MAAKRRKRLKMFRTETRGICEEQRAKTIFSQASVPSNLWFLRIFAANEFLARSRAIT